MNYQPYRGEKSATQSALEIVESYPGFSTQDVAAMLAPKFSFTTVKRALNHLCDTHQKIENRGGGSGHPTAWYVVEHQNPLYKLADTALSEMRGMTSGRKRTYLAELLEAVAVGEKP